MKPRLFSFLAIGPWVVFWMNLWDNQLSYWFWISVIVSCAAVQCTVLLLANYGPAGKSENSPDWRPTEGSPAWVAWVVTICWVGVLTAIARHLPPYWSQLFPLLVILALYCASRLWTARKSEEKLEDLPSPTGAGREG